MLVIQTYLAGMGELADLTALAGLRLGSPLELRCAPARGSRARRIYVHATDGRVLGFLPPDDAASLPILLDQGASATASITAMVPAFMRPRLQIEVRVTGQRRRRPHLAA
ncbi:hypothetical protein M0638_12395 [Roseomonas sp. NAR14]|uniref:HIRAN domain-containing protein n=1 Tax=Roseomonas acroporae TaxID=2937791 RepID=A0A9X1Y725_9PROT|nr:hypothetical protein [Roseomonas acroporae]MCK8785184.1 hypothetical protein [Roseomonas acroporae]